MPSKIVMMPTAGSRPGISSFAIAPMNKTDKNDPNDE